MDSHAVYLHLHVCLQHSVLQDDRPASHAACGMQWEPCLCTERSGALYRPFLQVKTDLVLKPEALDKTERRIQ